MAEPNLNVEFSAVTDEKGKFRRLAKLLGLADADHARGKCEHLWIACTRRGEIDLPMWLVEEILGEAGPAALVEAELARWTSGRGDSKTRRMRISGARRHCTWMASKTEQSSKGGERRAKTASRVGGKFARNPTSPNQPSDPDPSSDPIPEDQISPSARDPAVPAPAPTTPPPAIAVPAASPPPAIREDIARTQPIAGDHFESSKSPNLPAIQDSWTDQRAIAKRETTLRSNPPPPTSTYDPDDPRARGRLAELTWQRVSDARLAIAAELKLPTPLPLGEITPAARPRGFDELSTRIREAGALALEVCDRVVANLVKQARAKRSIDWLSERAFGDKAWPNARDGIDPSARSAAGRGDQRATQPSMPTPPKFAREAPRPAMSDDERAERDALARQLAENPDAAASAELKSGRVPAHMSTAELVKRFGDGQQAPPASAGPDEFTDDERKPRSRKASTT